MFSRSWFAAAWCVLVAMALPALASAESAGTPAGTGAVGGYLDLAADHGCAVQRDRIVRCWGDGTSGQLGGGGLDSRLAAPGTEATAFAPGTVRAVATGDVHSCALLTSGAVRCWGQNGAGQLGSGTRDNRRDGAVDPYTGTDDATAVALGGPATAITAGGEFTCALMASGAVRCWGDGASGDLGSGGTNGLLDGLPGGPSDEASIVPLGEPAIAISAGTQHACALLASGTVRCWGNAGNGRLGTGTTNPSDPNATTDDRLDGLVNPASGTDAASTVPLGGPATAISAGAAHTCALLSTGDVKCWGLGSTGQLGTGRTDSRLDGVVTNTTDAPLAVPLKPVDTKQNVLAKTANIPAIAISAGDTHSCAILNTGSVRCWGLGASGQLGQGATDTRLESSVTSTTDIASRVGGGTAGTGPGLDAPAISVSAGAQATCAELANGTVRCWGNGQDGRLGSSATDNRLDGVLTAGTDEASRVPLGALPTALGDLTADPAIAAAAQVQAQAQSEATAKAQAAAAAAAAKPAVAAPLSAKVSLKGRTVSIAALMAVSKAGRCPKSVKVAVTQKRTRLGRGTLRSAKKGQFCRVSGKVRLTRAARRTPPITVTLTGKGVVRRALVPTR